VNINILSSIYQTTLGHIPTDNNRYSYRHHNLHTSLYCVSVETHYCSLLTYEASVDFFYIKTINQL